MRRRERQSTERSTPTDDGPPALYDGVLQRMVEEPFAAYLAPLGFAPELRRELGGTDIAHGRLSIAPGPPLPLSWAQNVWLDPVVLPVASIKDAARQLRGIQRNWCNYAVHLHRRSALVADQLPHVSAKPIDFPAPQPKAPLGSWTFLDEKTVLASASCSSPFPNGEARFIEDHENPPSRAYLKLWEALTLFGKRPGPGEKCLDLGSSPGGWTWVLGQLGCDVCSVDKAPLDERVAALPDVHSMQESAFALEPAAFPDIEWLFSDIICYPKRLHDLIEKWIRGSQVRYIIATVKFQAETDLETTARLMAMEGSRLLHLHHNKHELTFFWERT